MKRIGIIGGGPAGLMAAESAASDDLEVHLYDAKPSVGRKFLVAGKSGLNITNAEQWDAFKNQYSSPSLAQGLLEEILDQFDSNALRSWVRELGFETFSVRSGKVFPRPMKAAPLLRSWLARLRERKVEIHPRHRLISLTKEREVIFETPTGKVSQKFDAIILALGGASWPRTGSDGLWTQALSPHVTTASWQAANCGWNCDLPDELRNRIEGRPLKNLRLSVGDQSETGELMPTRYGFEGTPLYALGPRLRAGSPPVVSVDFKPMFSVEQLQRKMESVKRDYLHHAPQRWKLSETASVLLEHLHGPFDSAEALALACKACKIPLSSPRPIEEAISSAGGLSGHHLDRKLMIKDLPGIYACGEMLDWEAPTGGFLLQACFSTGSFAGISAKSRLNQGEIS